MPSRRRASPSASPSGAGSRGSTRSAPSTSTASPPRRRTTCAISTPADPPPSTSRRRGTAFMLVASRVPQTPSSSRSPGSGGTIGSEPVATTMCSAVWRTPSTSTTPVPASRPVPRSRSMPPLRQPALLAGVGVVRHHEVPPGQRGLDVDLRARPGVARALHRLARAQQASWRGCTPSRSTRRRPALARRRRRAVRGRPAPRRSARRGRRRRGRSRRSHCSSLTPSCSAPSRLGWIPRCRVPLPASRSRPWRSWSSARVQGSDQGVHGREREQDGRRCCRQQSMEVNMASTDVSGEATNGTPERSGASTWSSRS